MRTLKPIQLDEDIDLFPDGSLFFRKHKIFTRETRLLTTANGVIIAVEGDFPVGRYVLEDRGYPKGLAKSLIKDYVRRWQDL